MAFVPQGAVPHLVTALNGTPVGTLANFSLDASAIPFDPRDMSGQIPTLSATVTDLTGPAITLIDEDLSFRDWSGTDTSAKVVDVKGGANSGLTTLDTSTLFERLNTEQTTFPMILPDAAAVGGILPALTHWCLMAGVTQFRTPGNLLQAIPSQLPSTIGYLADNPAALRFEGPSDSYYGFVPTIGAYLPPLEVNLAQSLIVGAMFGANTELAEFRIHARIQRTQQTVIYTVRRLDGTYTITEKVGAGAETVLLTANYAAQGVYLHNVNVRVKANVADPTKIDLTLRVLEDDTFTDFTATAKTSTLTQRPLPFRIELGYSEALLGARTQYGDVAHYFLSEGSVLPEQFPAQQLDISTVSAPEVSVNDPKKIPGFTGNVWEKIKEFCAITEMDVFFEQDAIKFRSRYEQVLDGTSAREPENLTKSNLSWGVNNRETSKYVDIVYREMVGDEDEFTLTELWRADSVYSLEKGEYREEIVQTDSTFTVLDQPIVTGAVPVPYTRGYGSYVITGNDGYIVEPQWWIDNGGSVKVEATGTAGEIKLILQAPTTETVRAPYRISEGEADRPALYIFGSGLNLSKPKTVRIATGAGDAAQEAITFDSIFVTSLDLAYNAGYKVADSMGGAGGEISFSVPKDTLGVADPYGIEYESVPLGAMVYHGGAMHRMVGLSMQPSNLSVGRADQFTSVAATNDGLGPNATIADWNNLHLDKTVKEVNLSPLPQYVS